MKGRAGYTQVLVLAMEDGLSPSYHRIARALRAADIAAEVYPEKRKLAQQFSYAERKGIPLAVILGGEEAAGGTAQVRDLATRESATLPFARGDPTALVSAIAGMIGRRENAGLFGERWKK